MYKSGMLVYSGVVCTAVVCYVHSLYGQFVHDDIPAITRNHDVLGESSLWQVFKNDFWGTPMYDRNSHKSYRPLTTLSFRFNHHFYGLDPWIYHVTNVVLHCLCSVFYTRLVLSIAQLQKHFAAAAGIMFAAHPIHTEAVAGIVGRADILACIFFLLSFLAYHDENICGREKQVLISSLLATLSMLAKETGITVLIVNLLYDFYKSWPTIKRSILELKLNEETLQFARRAGKVLTITSLLLAFRLAMLQGSLPKFCTQDNPAAFHPYPQVRLLTFSYLLAFNCWLMLCPSTLSHDWQMGSIPLVTSLTDYRNLATCLIIACFLWLSYRVVIDSENQRHTPLLLGLLLLVVPFLPATNLVFIVGFVVAERVLYIPSLGFVLLVAYGAQLLCTSCILRHKAIALSGLVFLVTAFYCRSVIRNQDWSSREALVKSGIRSLPQNAKMHYNYANYLRDNGKTEAAKIHYKEAIRLWPTYASAHNNLGTLMEQTDMAERHFIATIRFSPGHVNAHYNLAQVYRKQNRTEEAKDMLQRCLRLDEAYTPAYLLLSKLHEGTIVGRLLKHVTLLEPDSPYYLSVYASWLRGKYRHMEAMVNYGKALRLKPDDRLSVLGACRTLRDKGQISRLHQLLIRWYIMFRSEPSVRIVYTGDLYIRSWDMYKPVQATSLPNPRTSKMEVQISQLSASENKMDTSTCNLCLSGIFREENDQDIKPG